MTVLFLATAWLKSRRQSAIAVTCAAAFILPVLNANLRWFGHILGVAPMLDALHETVHRKSGSFALYASYSVWWGGFTYGPRYMLDLLPLLVPLAAAAAAQVRGLGAASLAAVALACSMTVDAIGAFCYPHDRWNSDPVSVDLHHERLWDWSDNQIRRAWNAGPSPQNFRLVNRAAFRVPPP